MVTVIVLHSIVVKNFKCTILHTECYSFLYVEVYRVVQVNRDLFIVYGHRRYY